MPCLREDISDQIGLHFETNPIEIIIICISDNIYIIDTIYTLEIIETSIGIITDEKINDNVSKVNNIFDITSFDVYRRCNCHINF